MAAHKGAVVMALTELVNSDDKKLRRGKAREWIKRRRENVYFQNIFQELKVKEQMGFKDKFRMSVTDYEFVLSQISDRISPNERIRVNRPVLEDERLALTLRYLATGESFQSLSYQFQMSLVHGPCCNPNTRVRFLNTRARF